MTFSGDRKIACAGSAQNSSMLPSGRRLDSPSRRPILQPSGLCPGDHLGSRGDLRGETGVARATVNEAIRLLQERRRIVLRPGPGGGLFVAPADPVVRLGRTLLTVLGEPLAVAGAIEVREQL